MLTWTLRGCALILAAALIYATWDGFVENRAFAARGRRVLADPVAAYTARTTTTTNPVGMVVNEQTSNSAELFFRIDGGRRVRVNRVLPDDVLAKLTAGADVYLEYLPDAPESARFEGDTRPSFSTAGAALLVVAATVVFWKKM